MRVTFFKRVSVPYRQRPPGRNAPVTENCVHGLVASRENHTMGSGRAPQ